MLPFLIIIIYSALLYWGLLHWHPFFKIEGTTPLFIFIAFGLKIICGITFGLIYQNYFQGGDTFYYYEDSKLIYETFTKYPSYYLQSIFGGRPAVPDEKVFTYPDTHLILKDLGTYTIIHVHAVIHIFTFGYYSLHIFWVALLGLVTNILYYRVFWNASRHPPVVFICILFFSPSLLFWTSGLHKDAFVCFGFGLLLHAFSQIENGQRTYKQLFTSILVIGLFRTYLLGLIMPFVLAWFLCRKRRTNLFKYFSLTSLFIVTIGILSSYLIAENGIFELLFRKQEEFIAEESATDIQLPRLEPNFWGVLRFIPHIILNVVLKPYIWEVKGFLQLLAGIEVIIGLAFSVLTLYWTRHKRWSWTPVFCFTFFYFLSHLGLIGLLVDNIGSIVRYRSIPIYLGLLLIANRLYLSVYEEDSLSKV